MKTSKALRRVLVAAVPATVTVVSFGAAADIAAGSCVGFFGPVGSDPRVDAITGLIQQGHADQAAHLQAAWTLTPAQTSAIGQAVAHPDSQVDNGNCCATGFYHWQLTPAFWDWGCLRQFQLPTSLGSRVTGSKGCSTGLKSSPASSPRPDYDHRDARP